MRVKIAVELTFPQMIPDTKNTSIYSLNAVFPVSVLQQWLNSHKVYERSDVIARVSSVRFCLAIAHTWRLPACQSL